MITQKQLAKLKRISVNKDIEAKHKEIQDLKQRDPSRRIQKLKKEINDLANDLIMGEGDESEIIAELQKKKTTLDVLSNKDLQVEKRTKVIKKEIEEIQKEHGQMLEQEVAEIVKPIWKELFEMLERALDLNKELRKVEKAVNESKPKTLKFPDLTGRKNSFPFDIINNGCAGAERHPKLHVREENARKKGLI